MKFLLIWICLNTRYPRTVHEFIKAALSHAIDAFPLMQCQLFSGGYTLYVDKKFKCMKREKFAGSVVVLTSKFKALHSIIIVSL